TGYLGSGKTTLLNRILTEAHGMRYAVIVNEFGEIGIDNDLIVNAEEEIFEMNNGCICCTVRGDLIRILDGLMRRQGRFDGIVLGQEAFNLDRILEFEPDFLDEEHEHEHDEHVTSLSLTSEHPIDPKRFLPWIHDIVGRFGQDILRMKGILAMRDDPDRFVI